jgi:cytochrome c2
MPTLKRTQTLSTRLLTILAAAILITGCAAPQDVTIRNVVNSTADPNGKIGSVQGDQNSEQSGSFVLIWELFGTPTPRPGEERPAVEPTRIVVAALPSNTPLPTWTKPPVVPTLIPPTAVGQKPTTMPTSTATPTQASDTAGHGHSGNAGSGRSVFSGVAACASCHDTANGVTIVGPSLKGVANRAGTRVAGTNAETYLRDSIVSPTKYVVSGFQSGLMPQNFRQLLSPQQIDDLVAYLMTLK